MKLCRDIDLARSLSDAFGGRPGAGPQVRRDERRQRRTAEAILDRFFGEGADRAEMVLLADEVGLGKTFVALAVAVSILDAIRRSEAPADLPAQRPSVLVLTPNNEALYNKWRREAETFQKACARTNGALDWFKVVSPREDSDRPGNVIDLTTQLRQASKDKPRLVIARFGVFGRRLHEANDAWRRRALAVAFQEFGVKPERRARLCRRVLGSGSWEHVPELRDLRTSGWLWEGTEEWSADLERAFRRAVSDREMAAALERVLEEEDGDRLKVVLDEFTRLALARDWPRFPLVVIDEVHNLKNAETRARRDVERFLGGGACRLLGLSATPFQLRHDELLSVVGLRRILSLPGDRIADLDRAVERLEEAMKEARRAGEAFREAWRGLRREDEPVVQATWVRMERVSADEWATVAEEARPSRVSRALLRAVELERENRSLGRRLRRLVIRHRHDRGYRRYWVGGNAAAEGRRPARHFQWAPGMEVPADSALVHYLMMRAVSLAKDEKGRAGLAAELTGSYRHLVETSATWRAFGASRNPILPEYRAVVEAAIKGPEADQRHPKIQATVARALRAFEAGQKILIFCVFVKTAEALRDELARQLDEVLAARRERVFGSEERFEGFRRRFFNRREPLYSLVQDHPLLGVLDGGKTGVPEAIHLKSTHLDQVIDLMMAEGEHARVDEKPDRRLLLAALEHVAVRTWEDSPEGRKWLDRVLGRCREMRDAMAQPSWVPGRGLLGMTARGRDPEAMGRVRDPLAAEDEEELDRVESHPAGQRGRWTERLRREPVGHVIAPYLGLDVLGIAPDAVELPLLARHHSALMAELDTETRRAAGQVFRRILMAEEYLLRYLTDVPRDRAEMWTEYLVRHYTAPLPGHQETLRDRVQAYLEALTRAGENERLLDGYRQAATNLNVVQLVKGGMLRDRYFLGFNTPYRPEILVSTAVGEEGIDLHRECRHVIHHDLCWNPAVLEQRTGRVDRIGSKVERERADPQDGDGATLDIAVPYLAATYDERMFEEVYRRAQLFEVTMGGDFRVEGRIAPDAAQMEARRRQGAGIGSPDEDFGEEGDSGVIALPATMVERLRVDLAVDKGEMRTR